MDWNGDNGWDEVSKISKLSTFFIIYCRSEKATDSKIEMSLMHWTDFEFCFRVGDSMKNISLYFLRKKTCHCFANQQSTKSIDLHFYAIGTLNAHKANKREKSGEMCFTLCNQTKLVKFSVYPEQSLFSSKFGNKYWYHHKIPSVWPQHTHTRIPNQFAQKLKSANSKVNFCICLLILTRASKIFILMSTFHWITYCNN